MCHKTNSELHINVDRGNYDPTNTLTLRRSFSNQMGNRWRKIKGAVRKAVVQQKSLGTTDQIRNIRTNQDDLTLKNIPEPILPGEQAFTDQPSNRKLQDFMDWLKRQEDHIVLEHRNFRQISNTALPWVAFYIYLAYIKGIKTALSEMRRAGYSVPERYEYNEITGEYEEDDNVDRIINRSGHQEAFSLLYTKAFTELQGVVSAVNQQVSRAVTEGLLEKKKISDIVSETNDRIDKVGLYRSRTLARTEIVRSFNDAMLQEMQDWGVQEVTIEAEYVTARDERVCPICRPFEGRVFSIEEAMGLLPQHPQCRCSFRLVPVNESENAA